MLRQTNLARQLCNITILHHHDATTQQHTAWAAQTTAEMQSNKIGGRIPATGYALASGMGENSGMGVWIAANEQVVALGR
jgi:hypothetical protein